MAVRFQSAFNKSFITLRHFRPQAKFVSSVRTFHFGQNHWKKKESKSSRDNWMESEVNYIPDFSELMSRIHIVEDAAESAKIVHNIIKLGDPIAVDIEGVMLPTLGLIQIKTSEGQIYLFRTGRNRKLYTSGRLKEVFENSNIVKVFHASSVDCIGIYREGIRMWGLYDTALAHKVIRYQSDGISMNDNTISFNGLCEEYGFSDNPYKKAMNGQLWKRESLFAEAKDLPEDIIVYSAWDVEPLLDIYSIMTSIIEPDFVPLLNELCEMELLRPVDPDLCKRRATERRRDELNSVFIKNLQPGMSRIAVYEALAHLDGNKKVLMSETNRTAHLLMSNRSSAATAKKMLSNPDTLIKFGPESDVRLMTDLKLCELEAEEVGTEEVQNKLKDADFIVDANKSRKLIDMIIKVKCPVVMEFHLMKFGTSVDIFVGRNPPLKFDVNPNTVVDYGIGDLIASRDVTKIVGRIDTNTIQSVLKSCSAQSYKPANFFDISTGHKMIDYLTYGQSIFKTSSPSVKNVAGKLGIVATTHFETFIYIYHHLQNILPDQALEFLSKKASADLDIGASQDVPMAKESRKQLRTIYDTNAVHIRATALENNSSEFESSLKKFLSDSKPSPANILCIWNSSAVIEFKHAKQAEDFVQRKDTQAFGFKFSASKVDLKSPEKVSTKNVRSEVLEGKLLTNLNSLSKLGFFRILEDDENYPIRNRLG